MTNLSAVAQKFILHWGEMGSRWGVTRAVAQIQALLYLSEKPLTADEICESLGLARSSVSAGLRELQGWNLVKNVHLPGDRRDHFETKTDVFDLFHTIAAERKKREIDPAIQMLHDCQAEAEKRGAASAVETERLAAMLEFFELGASLYDQARKLPPKALRRAAKLGDKILTLFS